MKKGFNSALLIAMLLTTSELFAQKTIYYRQIAYNHVSPHVSLKGIHELTREEADGESHYVFSYDRDNRLTQIINNHYSTERRHPLITIDAYRTEISYSDNKETWIYFDKNGTRIDNERQVYKEEFLYNKNGFKYQLNFYNAEDKPMESSWKITGYSWIKKKKMVIEKRYNLEGNEVNVSPYFNFGTTGIEYSKNGYPKGHHNLSSQFTIENNTEGLATYRDEYDEEGNHVKWSYHDQNGKLIKNQWGYAYGIKEYDENGNYLGARYYDERDSLVRERPMVTNAKIKYAIQASREDSLEIIRISTGYLEALQELDSIKMKRVMHPQLAKRTIGFSWKEEKEYVKETSYDQMVNFSKSWNKSGNKFPYNPSNQAIILDIYDRIASVRLTSDNWVEYLHLIRENGKWSIINLLWSHKNIDSYSHHSR